MLRSERKLLGQESDDDRKEVESPAWKIIAVEFFIVFSSALFANFLFKSRESFFNAFFIALVTAVFSYLVIWARTK